MLHSQTEKMELLSIVVPAYHGIVKCPSVGIIKHAFVEFLGLVVEMKVRCPSIEHGSESSYRVSELELFCFFDIDIKLLLFLHPSSISIHCLFQQSLSTSDHNMVRPAKLLALVSNDISPPLEGTCMHLLDVLVKNLMC